MAFDKDHFQKVQQEIQRHLEDTEISKLAHWNASAVYDKRNKMYIGIPATLLSVILTWLLTTNFDQILLDNIVINTLFKNAPVIISLIISILSALGTFLNFKDLSTRHRSSAENLHVIWRDCKNWKTDFPDESMCEKAVQMAQQYRRRINEINRDAPQIPKWAWKSVSKQKAEGSTSYSTESNQDNN